MILFFSSFFSCTSTNGGLILPPSLLASVPTLYLLFAKELFWKIRRSSAFALRGWNSRIIFTRMTAMTHFAFYDACYNIYIRFRVTYFLTLICLYSQQSAPKNQGTLLAQRHHGGSSPMTEHFSSTVLCWDNREDTVLFVLKSSISFGLELLLTWFWLEGQYAVTWHTDEDLAQAQRRSLQSFITSLRALRVCACVVHKSWSYFKIKSTLFTVTF